MVHTALWATGHYAGCLVFDWQCEKKIIVCLSAKLPPPCPAKQVSSSFCHPAHLGASVESGNALTPDLGHTWPVDVNWERGKDVAFDTTVTSPLIPEILKAASLSEWSAAEEAETRKHKINDLISVWSWLGIYSIPKLSLYVHFQCTNYPYMYICTFANVQMYTISQA